MGSGLDLYLDNVPGFQHTFLETNGVRLHAVQAGPQSGPLVLLLHGFPEFWYGWRQQIGPLAQAGFRVLAPDLRGYNLSDKPTVLDSYRLDVLARDVIGLMDVLGRKQAYLVGHDWGAAIAWVVAALFPERIDRLVVLNTPYPSVGLPYMLRNPYQILRSLYIFIFQLPVIPEAILRNNNWDLMVETMQKSSRTGTFSKEDFLHYRSAWWMKGAFTAMLNYYRALVRRPGNIPFRPRITMPTLILWGTNDIALERGLANASAALCEHVRLEFFEQATHWVQHEEAGPVNSSMIDFFRG